MKALVVYYSRSGNTKAVAQLIAGAASGDLEELIEIGENRKGFLGWIRAGRAGMTKQASRIEPLKASPADYDIIYVGSPVWGWNLAPAVRSYLSQTDFGTTPIALFCTMSGSGQEKTFTSMREAASGANVVGEMAVQEAALKNPDELNRRVSDWVKGFEPMDKDAV